MSKKLISTRFDRIAGSSKSSDRTILHVDLRQVPDKGEVINIEGNPHVVFERSWAINDDGTMFCYVRLSPYSTPKWSI